MGIDIPDVGGTPQERRDPAWALFDTFDQPVSVFTTSGNYLYINRAGCELLGKPADALIGRSYLELFPDLSDHPFHGAFQRVAAGAATLERLEFHYAPLGLWSSQRLHRTDDSVVVFWEDVTAQKVTKAKLDEALARASAGERLFRSMIEGMPQLAWTARADGFIDYYNPGWYEFTGTSPAEMEGWGWQSVHDQALLPAVMLEWERSIATGEAFEMEFPLRRHDGVFRWFLTRVEPTCDDSGAVVRWVGVNTDIHAQKTALEQLDHTLESMSDAFLLLDRDYRIVRVNRNQEKVSRVARAASIGRIFWELFPATREPSSKYWQEYHRAMEQRVAVHFLEYYAPLETWTEVDAFPAQDGGLAVFFRDVTARELATQTLAQERAVLDALFREAPVGLAIFDDQFRFLRLNAVLAEMNALPIEAHVGRHVLDVLPGLPSTVLEQWKEVIRTGIPIVGSEILGPTPTESNTHRAWKASFFPVRVGNETIGLGTVVEDVTDERQLAEERREALDAERRARDKAEEATRLKDEFLATLSHELRTPLNSILGWSRLLQAGSLPEDKTAKALDAIVRNAVAQNQLIEALLDVSQIITGKLRLNVDSIDMNQILDAAIDVVRPAADAKGVRIQPLLDPDAGLIAGDGGRLQQIVWNLLTNAVKFTPRGGRVRVILRREESHIEISVADTGSGIAAEFLPYVFHRFRQQDGAITRRAGGLGLGLAIVKNLVELHGGTVEARSDGEGKGSMFVVRIPVAPVSSRPIVQRERSPSSAGAAPSEVSCPDELAGLKVLVIDDEADARALIRTVLEHCKASVTTAGSADEALERIRAEVPDVIVSDIGMPDQGGYTFIRRLRALPLEAGGRVPAVALTAYARPEDRTRALLEGFQSHASKPTDPQELVIVIANLAGRYA